MVGNQNIYSTIQSPLFFNKFSHNGSLLLSFFFIIISAHIDLCIAVTPRKIDGSHIVWKSL